MFEWNLLVSKFVAGHHSNTSILLQEHKLCSVHIFVRSQQHPEIYVMLNGLKYGLLDPLQLLLMIGYFNYRYTLISILFARVANQIHLGSVTHDAVRHHQVRVNAPPLEV